MATNQAPPENNNDTGQQQAQNVENGAKKVANTANSVASSAKNAVNKIKDKAKNTKATGNKFAKVLGKAIKLIGQALKAVFQFIGKILTALGPTGIIILILLVTIIAVIVACIAIFKQIMGGGYDASSGTMSSYFGIKGDSFYGARVIYFDNKSTSSELANVYLEFTEGILEDVNNYGIKITLEPGNSYLSAKQDTALAYALKLTPEDDKDIFEATKNIDHYGFTESEKNMVLDEIALKISDYYVVKDSATNSVIENKNDQADVKAARKALEEAYNANFGYMKNVCSKIIIKDYLLNSDQTLTLPKQNYLASIYMPKQDVTIKSSRFIYKVDDENTLTSRLTYTNTGTKEILTENEIDSSWYNEIAQKYQTYDKTLSLSTFTAIDSTNLEYLAEGKSLFSLIKDGTYYTYFSNTDNDFSDNNILANINSNDYLLLEFTSNSSFNFIDLEIKY